MAAAGAAIAGAGLISGIQGQQAQAAAQAQAMQARQQALANYLAVNVPDPAQQKAIYQKYMSTGQLDPAMETAVNQEATRLASINVDPASREAEMNALTKLQDISNKGGLDAQAKQAEYEAANTANTNEHGQQGAIMQNFAARGVGGSGAQLAAALTADQGDANRLASTGEQSASDAEQRALSALTQSGQIGANINSQDYTQAAAKASAQDAINRFNTQNQQQVGNSNVTNANTAAATNLANAQSLSNMNVNTTNKQTDQNIGAVQTGFEDSLQKASGEANALNGVASQATSAGQTAANSWANIGSAIGQGGAAIAKYANSPSSSSSDDDNSFNSANSADNSGNGAQDDLEYA